MKNNKRIDEIKAGIDEINKQKLMLGDGILDKLPEEVQQLRDALCEFIDLCDEKIRFINKCAAEEKAKALLDIGYSFQEIWIDRILIIFDEAGQVRDHLFWDEVPPDLL